MPKVPSGFKAAAEHPLKLAGADAFLAAAKQVDSLKPKAEGKMAVLKDRADTDREGLAASVALAETDPGSLALKASNPAAIGVLTVRANGTVWPKLRFDVSEGRFFVVKPGVGMDRLGHGLAPMAKTESNSMGMSSEASPIEATDKFCHQTLSAEIGNRSRYT